MGRITETHYAAVNVTMTTMHFAEEEIYFDAWT